MHDGVMPEAIPTQHDPVEARALIAALMGERGWSQERLAYAAGVDQGYLSRFLAGDRTPTDRWIASVIRALVTDSEDAA
jgi:hypothetical protein